MEIPRRSWRPVFERFKKRWPDNWRFTGFAARRKQTLQGLYRAGLCGVFYLELGKMTNYSPDLIDQTNSIFGPRSRKSFSKEDARQALDNICGFFHILNEWAVAEDEAGCDAEQYRPTSMEEAKI